MIALIAALLQAPPVVVSEIVDPTAKHLRVEIVATLSTGTSRQRVIADLLGSAIARGTSAFPRDALLAATSRGGSSLTARAMADHLRIGFSLGPRDFDLAVTLCDQFIREAMLPTDPVQRLLDEHPFQRRTAWQMAWFPGAGDAKLVTPAEVTSAYRTVFQPGQVSIAVGGPFTQGEFRRRLGERFQNWNTKPSFDPRLKYRTEPPATLETEHRGGFTLVRIGGPVVPVVASISTEETAPESTLAQATLATILMGLGKSSVVYSTLRELLGQSYRQEAMLVPHADGLEPVIAWASTRPEVEAGRKALLDKIDTLTESDLRAARQKLPRYDELGIGLSPFQFATERPLGSSLDDRTFMEAYWRLKTGRAWTLPNMSTVTLEQVRAFARRWVSEGRVDVLKP